MDMCLGCVIPTPVYWVGLHTLPKGWGPPDKSLFLFFIYLFFCLFSVFLSKSAVFAQVQKCSFCTRKQQVQSAVFAPKYLHRSAVFTPRYLHRMQARIIIFVIAESKYLKKANSQVQVQFLHPKVQFLHPNKQNRTVKIVIAL